MNWERVVGNWQQLKGVMQQQWDELTDDDLDRIAGRHEELVGAIQARHDIPRDRVERQIEEFFASLRA